MEPMITFPLQKYIWWTYYFIWAQLFSIAVIYTSLFFNTKDVEWAASKLPNVKQVVLVNDPSFNHIDMVFHRNVKDLVYNQVAALIPPP